MKQGEIVAGKYRLNHLLGTGGMAAVWAATNVFTERDFAIKFLLPQVARSPDADRRFLLEAKVSARINHPNIIEVIDVGQTEEGALFLVMELLNGMPLDEAVRSANPPFTVRDFLAVMRDVANALAVAHRRGVIHRDLKPSNIFLHEDRAGRRVAKVLDFGVSKVLGDGDVALTMVGTVLGSPLYMSPEQALGAEGIDQRTDVFAFGAILFEALCGERPYSATNFNGLIVAIATTQPKPIDDLAPELPPPLRALVRECLATDKTMRLSSFDTVGERLTALIDSLSGSTMRLPVGLPFEPDPVQQAIDSLIAAQDEIGHESRRMTSVSPHSLPTPDAPPATLKVQTGTHRSASHARRILGLSGGALAACTLLVALGVGFIGTSPIVLSAGRALAPSVVDLVTPSSAKPEGSRPASSAPPSKEAASASAQDGHLSVTSTPSWCALSVDGALHGLTPVAAFGIGPGTHRLDCVPPSGRAKSATVTVAEGADARYEFALSE
jgi:serine/threonine-protein kinase